MKKIIDKTNQIRYDILQKYQTFITISKKFFNFENIISNLLDSF